MLLLCVAGLALPHSRRSEVQQSLSEISSDLEAAYVGLSAVEYSGKLYKWSPAALKGWQARTCRIRVSRVKGLLFEWLPHGGETWPSMTDRSYTKKVRQIEIAPAVDCSREVSTNCRQSTGEFKVTLDRVTLSEPRESFFSKPAVLKIRDGRDAYSDREFKFRAFGKDDSSEGRKQGMTDLVAWEAAISPTLQSARKAWALKVKIGAAATSARKGHP